jgi:hypothetical protein
MAALASEYGVATYPTFVQGLTVTIFGGVRVVGGFSHALDSEYPRLITLLETSGWRGACRCHLDGTTRS